MIEIPVLNTKGEKIGSEKLDPALFGDRVRIDLLKQAVVTYRANQRQGTVATKNRSMVAGSTRKLYRQKGTGNARAGNIRTPVRKGGGRAFPKSTRDFSMKLPRQMRRLARNSAILAKARDGAAVILDGLKFSEPKTKELVLILKAVKVDRGALLATSNADPNLYKSGRNIPSLAMKLVADVNAYDVLRARNVVFTRDAFKTLIANPETARAEAKA
ncbi:MAG TPA: 50S ribosomal protein L4 [Phycisphaerae bacterium]|nr:50S ribosomal protein L4 [Phycisphaerae bacterium]